MPEPSLNTYRKIWKVAYPIILGLTAQNLMVVIDTAFLGQLGKVELGAGAVGGMFYLTLVMLGAGFGVGLQIMIGRRNGEGNYRMIGRLLDHGIYAMLFLALVLFSFFSLLAPTLLSEITSSEAIYNKSLVFWEHRRYGYFFGFLVLAFNSFYIGTIRTGVVSVATIIMAVSNVILDYGLIFGNFGLPKMGIAGAAMATNIAEVITFAFYLIWTITRGFSRKHHLFRFLKPRLKLYARILKVAAPVMLQFFIAFTAWFVFFLIIEKIGETALAASNISRSIYMLFMIPGWGLGSATSTLVSNTIGQGKPEEVFSLIRKIVAISIVLSLVFVQVLIFLPDFIISIFTENPALVEETRKILFVIIFSLCVFSVSFIIFSALSGTGKTGAALRIEIITITIYLSAAFFVAQNPATTAQIIWILEILYFSLLGLFSYLFLKYSKWRKLVI